MSARLDEWEALLDEARAADPRFGGADMTNRLLAFCLPTIPEDAWRSAVRWAREDLERQRERRAEVAG